VSWRLVAGVSGRFVAGVGRVVRASGERLAGASDERRPVRAMSGRPVAAALRRRPTVVSRGRSVVLLAIVAAACCLAAACSGSKTTAATVRLDIPETPRGKPDLEVKDGRIDPQTRLADIDATAPSDAYPLNPEPAIEIALERAVYANLPPVNVPLPFSKVDVKIQELRLERHSGFARADDLTCAIESTVVLRRGSAKSPMKRVRTEARNRTNSSPRAAVAGKVILQQCLTQHAIELIQSVGGR